MDFSTRSARLPPHANKIAQHREVPAPVCGRNSQTSIAATTSYASSASSTNDWHKGQNVSQSIHEQCDRPTLDLPSPTSQSHLNAPLPSPSAGAVNPFLGRSHSQLNPYQSFHPQTLSHQQQEAPTNPPAGQDAHPHPHHHHLSQNNHNFGRPDALPVDFLAEAAKRAQMACLVRDLGDASL